MPSVWRFIGHKGADAIFIRCLTFGTRKPTPWPWPLDPGDSPVLPYREPTLGEGPPGFMRPFAFGKLCCQWQRRHPHVFPLAPRQCPSYSQSVYRTAESPAISRHRPWVREMRKRRIAINFLPRVRHVSKTKSPGSMIVSHTGNRQPMCRELPVQDGTSSRSHLGRTSPQVPRYPGLNRDTRLISLRFD